MSQIEISISSFSDSTEFKIQKLKSSYQITMKLLDEIIDSETFYNQQHEIFEKIYEKFENKERDQLGLLKRELNHLCEKHLRFKTLSLEFDEKNHSNYHLQFQSICKYKPESSEEQEKERNKAILDGYYIVLKTDSDHFHRIHSPDENSHPILIRFIRSTADFLREKYPIDFQDKRIIYI